jgi:hypothetical protein
MAEPLSGNDWFEIYNSDALPVELGGLYLSDDPSIVGAMRNRIPALSFIAGRGWAKWDADGDPGQGAHHVNFSLNRLGQTLRLYNTGGGVIDGIDFGPQSAGASSGRLSDGQTNVVQFSTTPTPESSNYLPLPNVVINEVLSHTDPPLEDAVELANFSGAPVDIGGWYLSDDPANLRKFQIPAGTVLQAGSYKVYYDVDLNGGMGSLVPFDLNSARGDAVHLTETNGIGGLTGYRAVAEFGPSANGVSFGRYATSVGIDFVPMSRNSGQEAAWRIPIRWSGRLSSAKSCISRSRQSEPMPLRSLRRNTLNCRTFRPVRFNSLIRHTRQIRGGSAMESSSRFLPT